MKRCNTIYAQGANLTPERVPLCCMHRQMPATKPDSTDSCIDLTQKCESDTEEETAPVKATHAKKAAAKHAGGSGRSKARATAATGADMSCAGPSRAPVLGRTAPDSDSGSDFVEEEVKPAGRKLPPKPPKVPRAKAPKAPKEKAAKAPKAPAKKAGGKAKKDGDGEDGAGAEDAGGAGDDDGGSVWGPHDEDEEPEIDLDTSVGYNFTRTMEPAAELLMPLLPYQKQFLAWAVEQEQGSVCGGVLADEMGMGKTIQAIRYAEGTVAGWMPSSVRKQENI